MLRKTAARGRWASAVRSIETQRRAKPTTTPVDLAFGFCGRSDMNAAKGCVSLGARATRATRIGGATDFLDDLIGESLPRLLATELFSTTSSNKSESLMTASDNSTIEAQPLPQ